MTAEIVFILLVAFTVVFFLFDQILEWINNSNWQELLPENLKSYYSVDKYQESRQYAMDKARARLPAALIQFFLVLGMLFFDGFAWLDAELKLITVDPLWHSYLFLYVLILANIIIGIPFAAHDTFVTEEKYGFNKTTKRTFIVDFFKSVIVVSLILSLLLIPLIWFYNFTGSLFWLYLWATVTVISILLGMFYSSLIMPLFNKLEPLKSGELRDAIESYCKQQSFPLENLFVIDGSKRSTKTNALFTGFGSRKKIILYDTLIEDHTVEELVAIVAHETGHYKHKHILYGMIVGTLQTGVILYLMSLFISMPEFSHALGMTEPSLHAGLIVFLMLIKPINLVLSLFHNIWSRKNEFQADAYAVETANGTALSEALIKMAVKHLSNLTPHPWYVMFKFSHPPLLQRMEHVKELHLSVK